MNPPKPDSAASSPVSPPPESAPVSTTPSAPAGGAPAPSAEKAKTGASVSDFPDRLSPMLVKELRQGMRTNLFTTAFILLQGLMVLCVLIGSSAGSDSRALDSFFWFFLSLALLFVMPIRGFNALSSEIKLNTMDLISLTRLSAWRITLGKWTALFGQTLLLFTAVLPYVVLRYFFGGVNLFLEIYLAFCLLVLSGILTAIAVGFSAFPSVLLRSAIFIVTVIVTFNFTTVFLFGDVVERLADQLSSSAFWGLTALIVFSGIYFAYFLLDMGASRIAPLAENHATRKRIIALFVSMAFLFPAQILTDPQWIWTCIALAAAVQGLVLVDALTEQPAIVQPISRAFVRNRWTPACAQYLFAPGWHTGLNYFVLCAGLTLVAMWGAGVLDDRSRWLASINFAGAIIFPLLILCLFFRRTTNRFGLYILIQCCALVLMWFAIIVAGELVGESEDACYILPIPLVCFFSLMWDSSGDIGDSKFILADTLIMSGAPLLLAYAQAFPLYREMRSMTRHVRETPFTPPEAPAETPAT